MISGQLRFAFVREIPAKVQADLATYQHESAQTVELLRSVVSSANEILKTLMLLNGGAAVALLAFMGHLVSSGPANAVSPFGPPLLKFVAGLVVSGLELSEPSTS